MLYGPSYEGVTRECNTCGHVTNVHSNCNSCEKPICENCEEAGNCSSECRQKSCPHDHVRYELIDDVDEQAGYFSYREYWTCRDCGADLEQCDESFTQTERRAA